MRRLMFAAAVAATVVGCGTEQEAPAADATTALTKARATIDSAKAVQIDLSSSAPIPKGHDGVSAARGTGLIDATTPKFKGKINAVIKGTPGGVDLICIGDKAWMTFFTKDYNPVDLSTLGAPNPAKLFRPGTGLASILGLATNTAIGKEKRFGDEVLQTYTGTVPASVVKDLLNLGEGAVEFDGEFGLEPLSGQLREAKLTGAFYPGSTATYTLILTNYGTVVDIQEP